MMYLDVVKDALASSKYFGYIRKKSMYPIGYPNWGPILCTDVFFFFFFFLKNNFFFGFLQWKYKALFMWRRFKTLKANKNWLRRNIGELRWNVILWIIGLFLEDICLNFLKKYFEFLDFISAFFPIKY